MQISILPIWVLVLPDTLVMLLPMLLPMQILLLPATFVMLLQNLILHVTSVVLM